MIFLFRIPILRGEPGAWARCLSLGPEEMGIFSDKGTLIMVEGVFPKAILGEWVPGGLKLQMITSPLTVSTSFTCFHTYVYSQINMHVCTSRGRHSKGEERQKYVLTDIFTNTTYTDM